MANKPKIQPESIHAALWKWFMGCASITRLFFNFSGTEDGDTAIATSGDMLLEDYISGNQLRRYAFDLIRYLPATFAENDTGNVDMMEDIDSIVRWVQEQNDAGNFPQFPDGCTVESIEVLDDRTGYVAATDQNMAKYMIPFAIEYMQHRKDD